ncbi:hypothetical protein HerbRD11066_43510 [Herbidospora sp. RD11066]
MAGVALPGLLAEPPTVATGPKLVHEISADTANNPPQTLMAAGSWVVAAYYAQKEVPVDDKTSRYAYTWWVYSPGQARYVKTDWQWAAISPDRRQAAALEGELPTTRLTIYDLTTMRPVREIALDHPGGGLAWSPDGTKLVVTTYSSSPDEFTHVDKLPPEGEMRPLARTGFATVQVATGEAAWVEIPPVRADRGARIDFEYDADNTRVWAYEQTQSTVKYRLAPQTEPFRFLRNYYTADGRQAGSAEGLAVDQWGRGGDYLADTTDGRFLGAFFSQMGHGLLAWVDDDRLLGYVCPGGDSCDYGTEFTMFVSGLAGTDRIDLGTFQSPGTIWQPIVMRR